MSVTGRNISLAVRAAAHMAVDALCACILFGSGATDLQILVYDTLAFSTQCITGMIADRYRGRLGTISAASCLLIAAAFLVPAGNMARAAAAGIGNSFFHTSAGAAVLIESNGKAYPQGVFVAPGAIGLTVGTLFPKTGIFWFVMNLLAAFLLLSVNTEASDEPVSAVSGEKTGPAVPVMLFAAVAVRAFAGSAVNFSWKNGAAGALLMTAAVFAGKTAGGFLADKYDVKKLSLISVSAAAVLTAFCSADPVLSLTGQFLINLTMPVTLWLMYLALPDEPGFAFGLAAAALWPGTLTGYLVSLTGAWRWVCVLICFLAGTAAINYSINKIKDGGKQDA